jgi:hypothetical protein
MLTLLDLLRDLMAERGASEDYAEHRKVDHR